MPIRPGESQPYPPSSSQQPYPVKRLEWRHHCEPQAFLLVRQNVCGLCHKVDAAKNDVPAIQAFSRHFAQLVRVAGEVSVLDHFVLLVMVPQD